MMHRNTTAEETGVVSRNCVIDTMRTLLRNAVVVRRRFTVEQLAELSGVKVRAIRSYMVMDDGEVREPSLSSALSIATVLGIEAVNAIVANIGYAARPLDEAEDACPMVMTAAAMQHLSVIATAAADGRIDHVERPAVREAADMLIATVLPVSSHGDAS